MDIFTVSKEVTSLLIAIRNLCREAAQRQKGLAETLKSNAQKVEETLNIVEQVRQEVALQTPAVHKLIQRIEEIGHRLKNHLNLMSKIRKRFSGFFHQVTKGSSEHQTLAEFFRELGTAKQDLMLQIQVAQLSLTTTITTAMDEDIKIRRHIQSLVYQVSRPRRNNEQIFKKFYEYAKVQGLTEHELPEEYEKFMIEQDFDAANEGSLTQAFKTDPSAGVGCSMVESSSKNATSAATTSNVVTTPDNCLPSAEVPPTRMGSATNTNLQNNVVSEEISTGDMLQTNAAVYEAKSTPSTAGASGKTAALCHSAIMEAERLVDTNYSYEEAFQLNAPMGIPKSELFTEKINNNHAHGTSTQLNSSMSSEHFTQLLQIRDRQLQQLQLARAR